MGYLGFGIGAINGSNREGIFAFGMDVVDGREIEVPDEATEAPVVFLDLGFASTSFNGPYLSCKYSSFVKKPKKSKTNFNKCF